MRRTSSKYQRGSAILRTTIATVIAAGAMMSAAGAVSVTVNYTADLTPVSDEDPNPGFGTISGSLGTFDVNAVGDTFILASDGSLSANVSGFNPGFPNGALSFVREFNVGAPTIEFLSIGPTAADFSINFIDNNAGILSAFPNECMVSGVSTSCFIGLFDEAGTGMDRALAALALNGSNNDSSIGDLVFSFEVSEVPLPGAVWVMIAGLAGLGAASRRS